MGLPAPFPPDGPPHLLIVDDEAALRRTLSGLFRRMGYWTTEAACGEEALEHITQGTFDVVLLDLRMPGMDGTEVLEAAHPLAPATVFIILTAYGTLDSAIAAIRYGAFDYLLKPSPTGEIIRAVEAGLAERRRRLGEDPVALLERALADLRAASRQAAPPSTPRRFLQAPGLTVDTHRRLVVAEGRRVELTPTEFEILVYLMRHADRVVSPQELASHLRGCVMEKWEARTLLRSHIHRLRRKLGRDPSRPRWIHTIRGSGYMFSTGD
ncbi:TPA: response regulator transcription factor [Candidatus Bipolaricaulota bacterium]|nr:response regulator transcription factor [Candidatus Bipolaricaulota bacterium]